MSKFWDVLEKKEVPENIKAFREALKHLRFDNEAPAEPLPKYILEMIEVGLLYPDGKRAVKNIQDIADFLVRKRIKITGQFLAEMFRTKKGKPYSLNSCNDAVNLAMTKPLEYKPVKNK